MAGLATAGIAVLAFIAGAFTARFDTFPYPQLFASAFDSLEEVGGHVQVGEPSLEAINFWHERLSDEEGLVTHVPDKSFSGYTFYTSAHFHGALLLDVDGEPVHQWELDFEEVWPDPPHVESVSARRIYWRSAHLYPNGDVLVQFYAAGATPYGYGLAKVDRDSELLWSYPRNVHHDMYVAEDGTIYTIDQAFRDTREDPVPGNEHLDPELLEDFIVKLSPEGEELQRVAVFDALASSGYQHVISLHTLGREEGASWDPLHTNSLTLLSEEFAAHHELFEPGQVMISMRSIDTVAVVDMDDERVVWANRGFWFHQHDPDVLDNGNLLIFDNRGHLGPSGGSRLLEVDPITMRLEWMYAGTPQEPFFSEIRSNQQVLPNGNLLINEHNTGRIFEITRDHKIVWEYHNPYSQEEWGVEYVAATSSARRFAADELSFEMTGADAMSNGAQ